jgi:hypothetical protein
VKGPDPIAESRRLQELMQYKKKRQKEELKDRRIASKAPSIRAPSTYNGELVFDTFEAWAEEVADWHDVHGLTEYSIEKDEGQVRSREDADIKE